MPEPFMEPRNRFQGTSNRIFIPAHQAGNRFLGSLKDLQIRAQLWKGVWGGGGEGGKINISPIRGQIFKDDVTVYSLPRLLLQDSFLERV
jgi:hypothetical protein